MWRLDTNIGSHVIKGDRPEVSDCFATLPMPGTVLSAVTEGELLCGLATVGSLEAYWSESGSSCFGWTFCQGPRFGKSL